MENPTAPAEKNLPINLYKKMHAIMERVDFIKKDKKNDFHNYDYASEEIIKKTLHAELVKEKVLFLLSANEVKIDTASEKPLTHVKFFYQFIDVDTGEAINGAFVGTGEDKGDKGTYKAITGAIKYILTSTFLIPTGNDPENSATEDNDETPWLTENQYRAMLKSIVEGQGDVVKERMKNYRMKTIYRKDLEAKLEAYKPIKAPAKKDDGQFDSLINNNQNNGK